MPLRTAAFTCQLVLLASLAATLGTPHSTPRLLVMLVVLAPLLATLPGLWRSRRPLVQRLTVILVLYVGVASVEVVARLGATAPSIALLTALLELGLLLAIIRRGETQPAARE